MDLCIYHAPLHHLICCHMKTSSSAKGSNILAKLHCFWWRAAHQPGKNNPGIQSEGKPQCKSGSEQARRLIGFSTHIQCGSFLKK